VPNAAWQTAALSVMRACEAALWSEAGKRAREWLHGRGLRDDTLRAWRIGYQARDGRIAGLYVPRGIVIPCLVGGAPHYVKVRRPVPPLSGAKYQQVAGGRPALYGVDNLAGQAAVVICEGELDALLLWQEARDLADVVAIGSASTRPDPLTLLPLVGAERWLVATDVDAAGERAAMAWGEYSARVTRLRPPQGNDVTDFWQAGGDLRAWVAYHLWQAE